MPSQRHAESFHQGDVMVCIAAGASAAGYVSGYGIDRLSGSWGHQSYLMVRDLAEAVAAVLAASNERSWRVQNN